MVSIVAKIVNSFINFGKRTTLARPRRAMLSLCSNVLVLINVAVVESQNGLVRNYPCMLII
jgi:hypothetical protein